MCKVSTLNNVEPPSINVFCKADQLPEINKCRHFRQPLALIDEQNGLNCSLPQLKEINLPPATSHSSVTNKMGNECEPIACTTSKKDHEDLPKCRRASTPFVTANPKMITLEQANENIPVSAVPLATDRKKLLNRPRLCVSMSYPGASNNAPSTVSNLSRVPTPPKSPPKNRPATPFLLTRSRSVDAKNYRYNLQTVGETRAGVGDIRSLEVPSMELLDEDSFMGKKIERDKLEKFNREKMTMKGAMSAGKSDGHSCKIRMDMTAFTKWIEEHRLP